MNAKTATRLTKAERVRFTVIDLAETAGIPMAKARRLIKDLGNDAEILLQACSKPEAPRQAAR